MTGRQCARALGALALGLALLCCPARAGADEQPVPWYTAVGLDVSMEEHRIWFLDDSIVFIPNAPLIVSPTFAIPGGLFTLGLPLESSDEEGRDLGNTDYLSLHATYRFKDVEGRAWYEWYKGFYLRDVLTPANDYYTFAEFESERYGASLVYHIGFEGRDALFARMDAAGERPESLVDWGALVGVIHDRTRLSGVPEGGAFPGGGQLPFSEADMATTAPLAGLVFFLVSDMGTAMGIPGEAYVEVAAEYAPGRTEMRYTSLGAARTETMGTDLVNFRFDGGCRTGGAFFGVYVTGHSVLTDMVNAETVAFGLYGGAEL